MRRTWKSFLSLLLVFAMVLSLGVSGFALDDETEATAPTEETAEEPSGSGVELSFEKVDNDIISERLPFASDPVEEDEPLYADDEFVRVSIVLLGASAIDAGYAPASAGAYRASLKAEQQALANKISAEALDGAQLDVVWNLTLAGNMMSAYVPYGSIDAIRNVIGVKDVVLETRYWPTEDETVDPENIIATEMTGATKAWNLGYTGAGSKIAVVDTGLDTEHLSFDPAAFQYAIDELNETRETPIVLMNAADVAAVWDQLNAASFIGSADGVYLNAKVPFAVNYVDRDLDVTHINDGQGEHGSHVAGIAAANKYISGENGFENALETIGTQGEAPDAQLLIMKVFGKGGGAFDSDYMIAVEDAMTLGCDAVNLSLGSAVAGYTNNATYAEILDKLTEFGLVWTNSAGNSYSWTQFSNGPNGLLADDVNYQTGGSPATYHNTLSVASVDNTTGSLAVPMELLDGTKITYSETSGYGNEPISTIAGTYNYVMILQAGNETADFGALGAEILEGKVAVAWRGSSSFYVKANAAAANGAVATIVANNQAGVINMNLTGYTYTAPAVSILQNDGYNMLYAGEFKQANGVNYIEGVITIPEGVTNDTASAFQQMSAFSSWGGNGALTMKPEITAPGGNIWSVWGANNGPDSPTQLHDQYEYMSGTSMASPQVAGLTAVLKQYIRESGLQDKFPGLTERAIAQSLLMSTSVPLREAATGYYWSILKQGSGLANANNAITARSLIQVVALPDTAPESAYDSIADGKVKVEVGEVNGGFTTGFQVTNFSDEDMSLYLNGEFFTQLVTNGFRTEYTTPVFASISWAVNGEAYTPADLLLDFNNDGVSNSMDAQTLLQWCADPNTPIYNLEYADLDGDGNVDTHDAKIAFETLNGASVELAAGETAFITASVSYDMSQYDEINGNYVEGFLFVREGETGDGALGVEHSIPVFGFNGCFSDASMFDRGSYLEYAYGFGDGDPETYVDPYMVAALGENAYVVEAFLVQYAGDSGKYYFGGNPLISDETYMPERNALNANDTLAGVRFTQIRNAGDSRFYVTDKYDRLVKGSQMFGGASYAAYYSQSSGAWQNSNVTFGMNYKPMHVREGDELTAHLQLALEYYVGADGETRWDDLGAGSEISIPFVIDNTAPDIVKVYRDSNVPPDPDDFELPVNELPEQPNEDDETPISDEPVEEEPVTDTLEIITHDNQFIAAVALFTDQGEYLDAQGAVQDTIRGKEVYYSFDLQEIFADSDEVYPYLLVQVYDYAMNLSTYKVNFVDDLENAEVESVTVSPEEATIIGTGSIKLSADVRPWGIDDTVTWVSYDESIATVDENGIVTGVSEGTTYIIAFSALDPSVYGYSVVTVKFIDKDLNCVLWDKAGEVWFADFNLKTLPEYTPLNEEDLRLPIASVENDPDGNLYAASFNNDETTLYTVDTETWTLNEIGVASFPYVDITCAPSLGEDIMIGCYGPYILVIDKNSAGYVSYYNMSSYTNGADIVGITYGESFMNTYYDLPVDWIYFVDNEGNLYETGLITMGGNFYNFSVYNDGNLGYTCDLYYWQSLYYDGSDLYWSHFNKADDKVDIILIDFSDGGVYNTGSFEDKVWPVGGLFEKDVVVGEYLTESVHSGEQIVGQAQTDELTLPGAPAPDAEPNEDEEPIDEGGTIAPVEGGLDFSRVQIPADNDPEKVETEVVVYISANELSYNGKITVDFDPTTVTLLDAIPSVQYQGVYDRSAELGHYVLAWVDLNGIEADGVILTLKFSTDSVGTVTITTSEENERDPDADEALPREELVFLGSATIPEDHEHSYELAHWTWTEDFSVAAAVFTCPQDGASKSYEAEITSETTDPTCTEPGKIVYTATVEVDGVTYTDVKEKEIPATGHEYGEPT
ncbi:MAG: S8 family serine peptidase, partial [Oscillospiraceae bacterium]|nr:S8 family serine peptidase [Oscillospiraceae bacterium]